MRAVCVTPERTLEVRDLGRPKTPPPGHVLIDMAASTITHGDKFFLTRPLPGSSGFGSNLEVYGSNGGGRVVAIGAGVAEAYAGKQVAIYKSLVRSPDIIGLWCERAQVPAASCLILPDNVDVRDYCGSFANVLTVHAFLTEIVDAGHKAVIVTAGTSATGRIAASLTRRRGLPAVFLVRSTSARDDLVRHGAEHVIVTTEEGFEAKLGTLAEALGATAVFDGVGGELLTSVVPALPMNATVYVYGFLGGPTPISFPTMLLMGKNLTLRRFSNLESATVRNPIRLAEATRDIEGMIDDPMFRTRIGRDFRFEEIDEAMAFETAPGARAVLVSST